MGKTTGIAFVLLVLTGLFVQGCVTVEKFPSPPFGTEAALYSQGELQVTFADTVFRTFEAARGALADNDIVINSAQHDMSGGTIEGTRRDGTKISILLRAKKPDITVVNIKVGTFGDEALSRKISSNIESRLKK
ncbi:MAG: DUF3568 domain-containing protein [Alphaproteobacteria bacterium]|uniref:DUF3568 domain-containing protein n=1 Tax=Candidatus Nitrobium versatile TaxID=2884831 RepID=A0A953M129_9BACT|nr:DUF3568 domain-containing protein [Candidatus Nitrobium versatile]